MVKFAYETPEIFEIGNANEHTLSFDNGTTYDNCDCKAWKP